MFFTNWVGADVANPVVNVSIGGRGSKGRLVRLGGRRQGRTAARCLCAGGHSRRAEEDRRRPPEARLLAGDLHPARAVFRPQRLDQVADRRTRRPGDPGVLECREEVGARGRSPAGSKRRYARPLCRAFSFLAAFTVAPLSARVMHGRCRETRAAVVVPLILRVRCISLTYRMDIRVTVDLTSKGAHWNSRPGSSIRVCPSRRLSRLAETRLRRGSRRT